ncbi:acrosin-binding protein [Podarcis muralis]
MLRLKLLRWACLVGFLIFLAQLIPRTLSYQPGSPLTTDEYLDFFASMRPKWKASVVCQIRRSKGCQDPKILQLDQYENHGEIPDGPICADLPHVIRFETFCLFAQFRCSNRRFYVKRILCPEFEEDEDEHEHEVHEHEVHEHEVHEHEHEVHEHEHEHEHEHGHEHEHEHEHGHEHEHEHEYEHMHRHEDEYEDQDEVNAVSPSPSQLRNMAPIDHSATPSRDARLRSNIDAILKYSFAVSGQEPVARERSISTPSSTPDYVSAVLVAATAEAVSTTEMAVSETEEPSVTKGLSNQQLHKSIHRLIGMAFSLEQSLNAENTQPYKGSQEGGREGDLNMLTSQEESGSKGSLLALDKEEALVILCYAVLQDICISSAVSKAWKQMESKTFGFGDLVCDSLGRRHADLCSECAFCSLKTEQCQGASNLKRTHCVGGIFTSYINPGILAQHQAMQSRVPTGVEEYFGVETYAGLKADYWCGRLAARGCDDYRVSLWLKTEYSSFQKGDFPKEICDSTGVQHPTYCAFKSKQCLKDSHAGEKVMRKPCQKNQTYRVLSREEGEEEVVLWNKKFFLSNGEGRE